MYFDDDFILLVKYLFDHMFAIIGLVIFMYDCFIHIGIINIDSVYDDYFARIGIIHNYLAHGDYFDHNDFDYNNLTDVAIING